MNGMRKAALVRNTSRPPGRSSRRASGIHLYGSHQRHAPYSEIARSKLASGSGTSSAFPWMSGNSSSCSACIRRAVASCASELSMPTGLAPRRASQAETYAVPQPSSITSIPAASSGNIPTSASGTLQIPQVGSSSCQFLSAFAT